GIRAEPMTAKVDVTELMGNEIFVYLVTGKKQFIARVDPRTKAKVGQEMDIAFNMDNIHLFDRQGEHAIR
ncbi:MAG: TOBE domain-containing protein, partial [Anaerolineae bacterium]